MTKLVSRRYLSAALGIAFVAFLAWYAMSHQEQFAPLGQIRYGYLVLILVLIATATLSNAVFIKLILKPFGKKISFVESIYVVLISSLGNFFAPAGSGFGFRGIYLKKKHGLSYTDYSSTLAANYIILLILSSVLGLFSTAYVSAADSALMLFFGAMFTGTVLISCFKFPVKLLGRIKKIKALSRYAQIAANVLDGWHKVAGDKQLLLRLIALSVFNSVISLLHVLVILTALGIHLTFWQLLLFSVLGNLSLFINITPGNLGVKEGIYLLTANILGLSAADILSYSLIDRAALFIVLASSWLIVHGNRMLAEKLISDADKR